MIEIIAKLSEALKSSGLPIFMLSVFGSTKGPKIEEVSPTPIEDDVPGDNFPYFERRE